MAKKKVDVVKVFSDLNKKRRNKIAVGVLHDYPLSVKSLKEAKKDMDIVVVGPKKVPGFDHVKTEDAKVLVQMAKDGEVDAVFRGNFDAVDLYDSIHEVYDFDGSVTMVSPVVIKSVTSIEEDINKLVCVLLASPSNYKGTASKIENIDVNIKFFESVGIKPKIGLLSAGKPTDILEAIPEIDHTLIEAEFLVNWYKRQGYEAEHFNHQAEYAVLGSDIVVYPDGISGNQGMRAMIFFGDNDSLGGISTGLPFVYSQTAEAFRDWRKCLMFLNGYLNR